MNKIILLLVLTLALLGCKDGPNGATYEQCSYKYTIDTTTSWYFTNEYTEQDGWISFISERGNERKVPVTSIQIITSNKPCPH